MHLPTRRGSAEAGGGGCGGGAAGGSGAGAGDGASARGKTAGRGASLHLAHWMTQLPEREECEPPGPELQTWSVEELRKRSKELNLIEVAGLVGENNSKTLSPNEKNENEKSPSKSSSDSQITVRTSPVVVDTIPVCRQCHKKCLSKPNSPLVSQKETEQTKLIKEKVSSQNRNSSSSACSLSCGNCHTRSSFRKIERHGAIKMLNPKDAPIAANKVIDSIAESQKKLKSTSYSIGNASPLLENRSSSLKHLLERKGLGDSNSIRSPSPSNSSRNNSPLSTSRTTCSSMVFNSSANDLHTSSPGMPTTTVQCVIAQEKYLNEVKNVENVTLTKSGCARCLSKKEKTKQKAERALSKVLGINIITKRENVGRCMQSSPVFLESNSSREGKKNFKTSPSISASTRTTPEVLRINGDVRLNETKQNLNSKTIGSSSKIEDLEWGSLMLMGLSAVSPATKLMRVEPSSLRRPDGLQYSASTSTPPPPNIAVVPPTPDAINKHNELIDDSPDSPQPEDPPYVTLKRYGTLSSLERMPSDETDDGNQRLESDSKIFAPQVSVPIPYGASGGIMGWTARAGSFVVEKMNIFSYTETVQVSASVPNHKQPSFLERYLGVGEWRGSGSEEGGGEAGEGSGASGEEAWGTPSSGDLSDNAFPDSDHGTLSSPTKSSSSYAGDDDTELMMDELLMAPTIAGPSLRPLLPRRRLEPLMEEDYSDSGSEDDKATPTAPAAQGSAAAARGRPADVCCAAPTRTCSASVCDDGVLACEGRGARCAGTGGGAGGAGPDPPRLSDPSPDLTPTDETPAPWWRSRIASRDSPERRWCAGGAGAGGGGGARRGSASSASTPSTLERTAIHNPSPPPPSSSDNPTETTTSECEAAEEPQPTADASGPATPPDTERLSPRAEMRLALDQGQDMLADQEDRWSRGGDGGPWSWRAACQSSLLRRVASADAVTLCRPLPLRSARPHHALTHRTAPDTTSRSSVYAWKETEKSADVTEMERLAQVEAQTMRSRTRSLCVNGKILGFLRRRSASDSPRRTELTSLVSAPAGLTQRPFSPRRTTDKQLEKRFWKQITRRRRSCTAMSQV